MKINYENTALGLLEHIDPFAFRICEDGEHSPQEYKTKFGLSVVENFPLVVERFKKKIQYISQPFHEAYLLAVPKLLNVIDSEEINESGTFVCRSTPSETNTIFYDISSSGKGADFRIKAVIFFFTKDTHKDKPSLSVYVQWNNKGHKTYISEVGEKNGCTGTTIIADIFSMVLFMKYCELQTKIIKPESRDWHIGTKYLNETKNKIEVLDSTWFTTIVRSEGFKVRGHFRMQPCGHMLSERKLIWISDFEKEGYTRTAKVLSNQ